MTKITEKIVETFNDDNMRFTPSESRQIIEIIIEEEGLTPEQIESYDFGKSYSIFGSTWTNTISLVNYVREHREFKEERGAIKKIMNTPELFLLTTGRWIGWDY